ncbi:MAG: hypothetical protein ABGX05_20395, partial [Pirellulaceae bacterium]
MCKSIGRFIAWPLLICLVISLVGAEVLHYRLCHHHPAGPVQAGGCTWHAHANGVLHAHGPHDSAPDPVPTDPSPEYCLVCQVLSHDAPGVILFSTIIMVSEMTGSYNLLLPTMWVSTLCFLLCRRWSLYEQQVA